MTDQHHVLEIETLEHTGDRWAQRGACDLDGGRELRELDLNPVKVLAPGKGANSLLLKPSRESGAKPSAKARAVSGLMPRWARCSRSANRASCSRG